MFRITAIILFLFSMTAISQELYMPYNVLDAYQKNFRSFDGKPGKDYFQNKSSYRIKAVFDPETKILKGRAWIIYQNNSPEVLTKIVFRLYPDLFKKGNPRDKPVHPDDVHHGMKINHLSVNDTIYDLNNSSRITRSSTLMVIAPEEYLMPGKSLKISVDWEFKFPEKTAERFGLYNKSSYFVAYWYPQISVFDDIDGWDYIDFTGTQEFYNDFSDFKCEISVPSEYLIWATGDWINPEDILHDACLQKYRDAKVSDNIIRIVTGNELNKISKNRKTNTYRFEAYNVQDFAFAVSNNYCWDATSVICDRMQDRIMVHTLYPKKSDDFSKAAGITVQAVCHLSENVTGLPFPFKNLTAFNGSGGMEYPMMMNTGYENDYYRLVNVITHEACHMYFPFMVGTNEKKYAWMDEGLVTFLAKDADRVIMQDKNPYRDIIAIFRSYSGEEQDVALMVPSNQLRGRTYQVHAYYRSSAAFCFLQEYLGKEVFQKALKEFILRWEGRHPTPYDLFFTFNHVAEENLNWYWNAWFFNTGWVDLAVQDVEPVSGGYRIKIENTGRLPVSYNIGIVYTDKSTETIKISAKTWKNNFSYHTHSVNTEKKIEQVFIADDMLPDKNPVNNFFQLNN